MTLLWASILLLIIFAAIRAPRRKGGRWRGGHPYAAQLPLAVAEPWDLASPPPPPLPPGYGRAQVGVPAQRDSDETQQFERVGRSA
jgi:hypothetical protein